MNILVNIKIQDYRPLLFLLPNRNEFGFRHPPSFKQPWFSGGADGNPSSRWWLWFVYKPAVVDLFHQARLYLGMGMWPNSDQLSVRVKSARKLLGKFPCSKKKKGKKPKQTGNSFFLWLLLAQGWWLGLQQPFYHQSEDKANTKVAEWREGNILGLWWAAWGHTITAAHASLLTVWANILSLFHFGFICTMAKSFLTKLNIQGPKARSCAFYVQSTWLFSPELGSGHHHQVWTETMALEEAGWDFYVTGETLRPM